MFFSFLRFWHKMKANGVISHRGVLKHAICCLFFFFYVESSSFKMYQKYQNLLFDRMSRTKRKHSRSKAELLFPEKVRTERLLCRSLESGTGLKGEYNNTQP